MALARRREPAAVLFHQDSLRQDEPGMLGCPLAGGRSIQIRKQHASPGQEAS